MRKLDLLIAAGDTARRQESAEILDALLREPAALRWEVLLRRDPQLTRLSLRDYQFFLQSLSIHGELSLVREPPAGTDPADTLPEAPAPRFACRETPEAFGPADTGTRVAATVADGAIAAGAKGASTAAGDRGPTHGRNMPAMLMTLLMAVTMVSFGWRGYAGLTEDVARLGEQVAALEETVAALEPRTERLLGEITRLDRQRLDGLAALFAAQAWHQAAVAGEPFAGPLQALRRFGPFPQPVDDQLAAIGAYAGVGLPAEAALVERIAAAMDRADRERAGWLLLAPVRGLWSWLAGPQPAEASPADALRRPLAEARLALGNNDPRAAVRILGAVPPDAAGPFAPLLAAAHARGMIQDTMDALTTFLVERHGMHGS